MPLARIGAAHLSISLATNRSRYSGPRRSGATRSVPIACAPSHRLQHRNDPVLRARRTVPRPPRSPSRYRLYDMDDVRRRTFVRRSRELGFSLDEVRTLLALSADSGQGACAEVRDLAAHHLEDIRAKITHLRAMERVLADAVRACDAGEILGCPLIDSLFAG